MYLHFSRLHDLVFLYHQVFIKQILPKIGFFLWFWGATWAMASSFTRFLDLTQQRNKVGRNPLDE